MPEVAEEEEGGPSDGPEPSPGPAATSTGSSSSSTSPPSSSETNGRPARGCGSSGHSPPGG
eukprot:2367787-Alexandrium_andersonii.AAC.1